MDRHEFENISVRSRGKLLKLASGFTAKSGLGIDPEDIVQEALITLWRLASRDYPVRNPESLAMKITKNICVSNWRRRKNAPLPLAGDDYPGGDPATARADEGDLRRIKDTLYAFLSEKQRKYLMMRNDERMSLDEIALETGAPKTSIKSELSRARRKMLEKLKEESYGFGK